MIKVKFVVQIGTLMLGSDQSEVFLGRDFAQSKEYSEETAGIIDEETKAHLFEKYISGSNKYNKIGFGLGMYLSNKIIKAHEGDIYYRGEETISTFFIELPRPVKSSINSIKW